MIETVVQMPPIDGGPGGLVSIALAVIALLASIFAAVNTLLNKKLKAPVDVIAERKIALDERTREDKANDDILERFQAMLDDQAGKHAKEIHRMEAKHSEAITSMREAHAAALSEVNRKFTDLEQKFGTSEDRNRSLVEFVYSLVKIIKDAGLDAKLQNVEGKPHGIYIY